MKDVIVVHETLFEIKALCSIYTSRKQPYASEAEPQTTSELAEQREDNLPYKLSSSLRVRRSGSMAVFHMIQSAQSLYFHLIASNSLDISCVFL